MFTPTLVATYFGPGRNTAINSHVQVDDAKQRKRERERVHYAVMYEEQRNERNRNRWENRLIKNAKSMLNDGQRGDKIYKFKPSLSITL